MKRKSLVQWKKANIFKEEDNYEEAISRTKYRLKRGRDFSGERTCARGQGQHNGFDCRKQPEATRDTGSHTNAQLMYPLMGLRSLLGINAVLVNFIYYSDVYEASFVSFVHVLNDGDTWRSQSRSTIYGVICSHRRLCDREEDIWWSRRVTRVSTKCMQPPVENS